MFGVSVDHADARLSTKGTRRRVGKAARSDGPRAKATAGGVPTRADLTACARRYAEAVVGLAPCLRAFAHPTESRLHSAANAARNIPARRCSARPAPIRCRARARRTKRR